MTCRSAAGPSRLLPSRGPAPQPEARPAGWPDANDRRTIYPLPSASFKRSPVRLILSHSRVPSVSSSRKTRWRPRSEPPGAPSPLTLRPSGFSKHLFGSVSDSGSQSIPTSRFSPAFRLTERCCLPAQNRPYCRDGAFLRHPNIARRFARDRAAGNLSKPNSQCLRLAVPVCRVEEGRGAGPTGSRPFPFPAHQTGRARFEHPAFRQISPFSSRKFSPRKDGVHQASRRQLGPSTWQCPAKALCDDAAGTVLRVHRRSD